MVSYTDARKNPIESFSIYAVDVDNSTNTNIVHHNTAVKSFNVRFSGVEMLEAKYRMDLRLPAGYYELKANSIVDDPVPTLFVVD